MCSLYPASQALRSVEDSDRSLTHLTVLGSRSTTHEFDANYGANGIMFGHALGERYSPQLS
jgi:hypothetical protein